MQSITFRFIGHDNFLMDLCKSHINSYSFINCKEVTQSSIFLKQQIIKNADVVLVDLPIEKQAIYEFGIHLKRIFPKTKIIAISHREDFSRLLHLQHIEKLFDQIITRDCAVQDLDAIIRDLKLIYNIRSGEKTLINFTLRERKVMSLTCQELKNNEIAQQLRISLRTVETHKSNIYSKLGSKNPAKIFNYASKFGLL